MSEPRRSGFRGGRGGRGGGNQFRGNGQRQFRAAIPSKDADIVMEVKPELTDLTSRPATPSRDTSHLSDVRFDTLTGKIDPSLLSSIKFSHMSLVQAATFDPIISGVDMIAQAKTGTGKTVAFLLPTIQALLTSPPSTRSPCDVSILVLSPTRELALQIEKEAKMLLANVGNQLQVQHCIGGTNMSSEQKALQRNRCDILVATPGRLLDHIENSGLTKQLTKVRVVILDEADRMLDMGFRNELKKIMSVMPPRSTQPRQSLLFSATIPAGIREVADLDPNHVVINTLKPGEENTHEHVPQQYLLIPSVDMFPATVSFLEQTFKSDPTASKVILFFSTARLTGLFYSLLQALQSQSQGKGPLHNVSLFELHSRKSQSMRTKASQAFSAAAKGILCSSDVTARGVDFPGVTQVIQVGLPANGEQYIHRLGRTARAGASGSGLLLLNPAEKFFLNKSEMRSLSITEVQSVPNLTECKAKVSSAMLQVSDKEKAQAYQAALGYQKGFLKDLRWSPADLVREMNDFARNSMLYQQGQQGLAPPLLAKTVGKMGLRGTPGLNVVSVMPDYLDSDDEGRTPSKRIAEQSLSNDRVRRGGGGGGGRGGRGGGEGGGRGRGAGHNGMARGGRGGGRGGGGGGGGRGRGGGGGGGPPARSGVETSWD